VGMSVAAIGGGLAAQLFHPIRVPLLGTLEPSALVLFFAGLVMVLGAGLMPTTVKDAGGGRREPEEPHDQAGAGGQMVEQPDGREAAR